MQRCRQEVPRFELQLARVIVTIFDASFDGGGVMQKPPYVLSVELPILDESEFASCTWQQQRNASLVPCRNEFARFYCILHLI
jgi:hypothetical protein